MAQGKKRGQANGAGKSSRRSSGIFAAIVGIALVVAVVLGFIGGSPGAGSQSPSGTAATVSQAATQSGSSTSQQDYDYKFKSKSQLNEHFDKHGKQMGYANAQDYLAGANAVIANPDALHKKQRDDGDDVYYLEATDEFVVVSPDGRIRTYFNPGGIDYYNRQ